METLVSQAKFTARGSDHSVGRKPHFQTEFQKKWKEILKQCSCANLLFRLALYLVSRLALSLIISAPAKRHNKR